MSFLFFILLIVSNTKSTTVAVPAPLLLARPSCFSFLFMPLSLQPCPLHANLAEFTQAVFSIGQRLGFRGHNGLLSVFPSLQVTRQQGVACRQLSSSRGERKKSKHSAIRGELFGSNQNQNRRQCFFFLLFFPPSLPASLSYHSANR